MKRVDLACDVLVAGGGLAGVCAAVSAARGGAKVVLVQDRSRLGGNSSSEIKMHVVGANAHTGRPGWREGGLIEEFRLDDAANNPQRSFRTVGLVALRQSRQRAESDAAARHHLVRGPGARRPHRIGPSPLRPDRTRLQHHRQAVLRLHRRQPAGTGSRGRNAHWPRIARRVRRVARAGRSRRQHSRLQHSVHLPRFWPADAVCAAALGPQNHRPAAQIPRRQLLGVRLLVDRMGRPGQHGQRQRADSLRAAVDRARRLGPYQEFRPASHGRQLGSRLGRHVARQTRSPAAGRRPHADAARSDGFERDDGRRCLHRRLESR